MDSADAIPESAWSALDKLSSIPLWAWAAGAVVGAFGIIVLAYTTLLFIAPKPRPPRASEKQFITVQADGTVSKLQPLPCWYDNHVALTQMARENQISPEEAYQISDAEVFMSLVVPAYNEEERLSGMLEEAVEYLEEQYGHHGTPSKSSSNGSLQASGQQGDKWRGWEIIVVSDGSRDKTVQTALQFAKTHQLNRSPPVPNGPWHGKNNAKPTNIPPGTIRVVQLEQNRGKGGAVTHGMRHARGTYVVFADADGASKFTDLGKLVQGCEKVKDKQGRAVGVGSRAHMVGTEAVVKRSFLRNTLMRAFHLLIWTLTTPRTSHIKDTQCGFKLFSRPALPYIIPYMHSEGWIFDVEMLMLAESAEIPMTEVAIGWKEVKGSKLNVIKDSLGMAWGLAMLRVCWGAGIYRRD
ncbi:dolichyl-phosphate beta-glucosyltransferase [Hortaea werneckii]|uniref:dolichyl-phosphate beta-glucosyltransferase n=1 Tax=Hortaea werneckii TaxID=91943 RepID=A0A3M7H836_HORWE|nr:dolichyl-phosphate beta-glucosyltransferase [Hortaea werneckii]KAI7561986.1 dolichyl-phosphate beta-glucosyltransferase [Hortaea werneckii]KAI7621014.1 dolichyl-phosphate beta-glucosyltransferase [Hortaea werneckii]KAI7628457.1 dolichyl-phosphate beta-glucosyltransferase [Hortaea werneckii]KAI7679214.1 dolichyl-phosphate beta-glucosyltransferase [Hortaea werneckii]